MAREIEGPDFHEVEDSDYPERRIAQEEYQVAFLTGIGMMFPVTFPISPHFITEIRSQGNDVALSVAGTNENPIRAAHPLQELLQEIYGEPTTITEAIISSDEVTLTVRGESEDKFYAINTYAGNFNRGGFVGRELIFNIPQQIVTIESLAREFVPDDGPEELPVSEEKSLDAKQIFGLVGLIESASSHPDVVLMIAKQDAPQEQTL